MLNLHPQQSSQIDILEASFTSWNTKSLKSDAAYGQSLAVDARGKSMLARSAMTVVFVLDETINPGR